MWSLPQAGNVEIFQHFAFPDDEIPPHNARDSVRRGLRVEPERTTRMPKKEHRAAILSGMESYSG